MFLVTLSKLLAVVEVMFVVLFVFFLVVSTFWTLSVFVALGEIWEISFVPRETATLWRAREQKICYIIFLVWLLFGSVLFGFMLLLCWCYWWCLCCYCFCLTSLWIFIFVVACFTSSCWVFVIAVGIWFWFSWWSFLCLRKLETLVVPRERGELVDCPPCTLLKKVVLEPVKHSLKFDESWWFFMLRLQEGSPKALILMVFWAKF